MCGIFAYLNFLTPRTRQEIIDILIQGLQRLEYRGYDSAGVAIDGPPPDGKQALREVLLLKKAGKVKALEDEIIGMKDIDFDELFEVHCGIAHTRWATHGQPSWVNSHPIRSDKTSEFLVVHNGILTNYAEIKRYLAKKDYEFEGDTDTEVIAKLIHHVYHRLKSKQIDFRQLVEQVTMQLEGAFALAFKSNRYPGEVVATRRGSPLLVGIKSTTRLSTDHFPVLYSKGRRILSSAVDMDESLGAGDLTSSSLPSPTGLERSGSTTEIRPMTEHPEVEYFFASDASAVIEHTRQVIFLEDDDVASVKAGLLSIHRMKRHGDTPQTREVQQLNMEIQEIMKGNYQSYMQKEIFEQPLSVFNTMRGRINFEKRQVVLGGIRDYIPEIKRCRRLIFIGCGTSYHSAIATRQVVEELTELPVMIELASDFLDRQTPIFRDDVCFFISQSGETADTLLALQYCKQRGALILGITNTVGSSICRGSHCGVHVNAGPEIGVASTKAYTSQILAILMFALMMSDDRISMQPRRFEILEALRNLPDLIEKALQTDKEILELAKLIYENKSLLVMGRGYNFATCLEGALKVKELSYIHCEGIMSGELKHGPLAMVERDMPIVMIICKDNVYQKSLNALQQVVARDGQPIIVCDTQVPSEDLMDMPHVIRVPYTAPAVQNILTIIPLQLLSYHTAVLNGRNVDRPRNLAKSVTVE